MGLRKVRRNWAVVVVAICGLPVSSAIADDRGPIDQNFQLSFGTFFMNMDTHLPSLSDRVYQIGELLDRRRTARDDLPA